jgi:hypothetical protein
VHYVNAVRAGRAAYKDRLARRVLPHRAVRLRDTGLLEAAIRIAALLKAIAVYAERPECARCLPPPRQRRPLPPLGGVTSWFDGHRADRQGVRRGGPKPADARR